MTDASVEIHKRCWLLADHRFRPGFPLVPFPVDFHCGLSGSVNGNLWHYRSQSSFSGLFSLSPADSIMTSLNPPQAAPKWTHTPDEVLKLTKEAIEEERKRLDDIGALKSEDCTFESVRSRRD